MENVRNRLKIRFVKKNDYREIIKQQSKLTFNGIHKSYENSDSYAFKQNGVLMDKPIYLGFSVLELSKLHMYETYYDKLQTYFGQENLQLHRVDLKISLLNNLNEWVELLKFDNDESLTDNYIWGVEDIDINF